SHLNFDYNRAYQQIEIPSVHITHASGGTADILPSAVTDQPNPAVADTPAYQDVRIKSVRILGLAPGDALEYEVITITKQGPVAPNFLLSPPLFLVRSAGHHRDLRNRPARVARCKTVDFARRDRLHDRKLRRRGPSPDRLSLETRREKKQIGRGDERRTKDGH